MMRCLSTIMAWLALWTLAACGGAGAMSSPSASFERSKSVDRVPAQESDHGDSGMAFGGAALEEQRLAAADAMGDEPGGASAPAPTAVDGTVQPAPATPKPEVAPKKAKPLLIYTAQYTLAVFETAKAIDAVQEMAVELEGYLVRRDDRSITVRVPSEAYRGALDRISKIGDVLHREESVEDVTEQFMDLQTRLKNHRAMRARLAQLLGQTKNVEEALAVEKELARVTERIERIEGKLKRLRELIAFSTITVRFQARPTEQVRSNVRLPFPWLERLGLSHLLSL